MKTSGSELVKLVRMCAFIAKNDESTETREIDTSKAGAVTDKLIELLKPKLNTSTNVELAQVFAALVLLPA